MSDGLVDLLANRRFVVCAGTGGVGKTTIAASMAVVAARAGRKVALLTVDPARRLADAMGLDGLTNEPRPVAGPWTGELHAVMLDARATFDQLVTQHATSGAQAERILTNRFYQNVSGSLGGTQEYMAIEKLHRLDQDHDFDLIVVDTPPAQRAVAFLDAPKLIGRLLDNRMYQALIAPSRGMFRIAGAASQAVIKTMTRTVGAEVLDDAIAFFRAFEGMEEDFRHRADDVLTKLRGPHAAFVLVTTPRRDVVAETASLGDQLARDGLAIEHVVVNRAIPRFGRVGQASRSANPAAAKVLGAFESIAAEEDLLIEGLLAGLGQAELWTIPLLPDDVHDVEALGRLAELLEGTARD